MKDVYKRQGQLVARCDLPHEQISPQPGWVEHDPEEIYRNVIQVTRMVLEKAGVQPEPVSYTHLVLFSFMNCTSCCPQNKV